MQYSKPCNSLTLKYRLFIPMDPNSILLMHLYISHGEGLQWLSGRVLDSRQKGCGFEPDRHHCVVSLSKNINPSLILVQPRKTRPFITERLSMGHKDKIKQTKHISWGITLSIRISAHQFIYLCVFLSMMFRANDVGGSSSVQGHNGRSKNLFGSIAPEPLVLF